MKKHLLIAVSAIVAVSAGVLAYNGSKADDLFSANVEALSRREADSGTCCQDENSECRLSWVTIPAHYLRTEVGPCE